MLELWLITHGETPWHSEGRALGQSDTPLSEFGVRQGELLGRRLAKVDFDEVYASDLSRTRYSARLALPGAEIRLEPRLRDIHYGLWEGKVWAALKGREQEALEAWRKDPYRARIPDGESYEDVMQRVAAWLADLPDEGRVAAFTHTGTVRTLLYHLTGFPADAAWRFEVTPGSLSRVQLGHGVAVIQSVNDTAHLGY